MYSSRHDQDKSEAKRKYTLEIQRVIAPYVQGGSKQQEVHKENEKFSFCLKQRPPILLKDVSYILADGTDLLSVLINTIDAIKDSTNSTGASVYLLDESENEIYLIPRHFHQEHHRLSYKIETGSTVAAYVACEKEPVLIDDVLEDPRFPSGIGNSDLTVKSVLCVPIMVEETDCFAIFELYRDVEEDSYTETDLQLVMVICAWITSAISQNQERLHLRRQQELSNYLKELIKYYFADTMLLEKLITEITKLAKISLNAEHAVFVVIDPKDKELYADVYEEGIDPDEEKLIKKNMKIKLDAQTDIIGLAATEGITVNIRNAYSDRRVSQDRRQSYISKAILCMPIIGVNEVLGIIKIVNKKHGGCFSKADENLLNTFAEYSSFVLSYARLNKRIENMNNMNYVYLKMLTHHMDPCIHDCLFVMNHQLPGLPDRFNRFDFYINGKYEPYMPQLIMYMFNEIAADLFTSYNQMLKFILCVRKSYRTLPYHNFHHAFTVCHSMYNILHRNRMLFNSIEMKALLVASLCHDIDYFGRTNAFLDMINHPISQLYETSPMENHHFHVTMIIINNLSMFSNFSSDDYGQVITEIQNAILSTDISSYFHKRGILYDICSNNTFNWSNDDHRSLMKSTLMTITDLSGSCKPFPVAKQLTEALYEEFYEESDERKSMNRASLPVMDREQSHRRPHDQVKFLTVVVLPCALILSKLLPNCDGFYQEAIKVREAWREMAEIQDKKVWRQDFICEEE